MKINHVMSNKVQSGIYDSIINYFKKYAENCEIKVSESPIEGMDIYHYHRPHLEKKLRENSVVTVHHDLEDNDNWLSIDKFIERYREAEKIICLNTNQQRILNEKGLYNTIVIPHGYNNDVFNVDRKREENNKRKISLGIISKRYGRKVKGEAYLYELIKYIDSKKFKFILVGEGRVEDAAYLDNWGFETDVYEYLPYNCFNNLYDEIDFLLMISKYEGGPANIPEALASKTPIISFNIGMVTDYLVDKHNGIFLSGNVINDSEKINLIADDLEFFDQLKNNAKQVPKNLYTWKEVVELNLNVYNEIVFNNSDCSNELTFQNQESV